MPNKEFELISCEKIKHIKIFLNDITYRNYHYHSSFEVLYILDGNGRVNLANESIPVQPGSLIFLNQNEAHEIDALGGHLITVIIQISRHFCKEYLPVLSRIRFLRRDLNAALEEKPEILNMLTELICDVSQIYLREQEYFAFECLSHTTRLFHVLLREIPHENLSDHDRSTIRKRVERMDRLIEYIETNYSMPIRLQKLAEIEGVTTTYISHFFSDNIGITFQEYLNNLRFEQAISLLQNPSLSLGEVALSSGFSDPKYLNKMMQQKMGCSVKNYRQGIVGKKEHPLLLPEQKLLERQLSTDDALKQLAFHLENRIIDLGNIIEGREVQVTL